MQGLYKAETIAMCLIMWALFAVVGAQFFTRYVLNDSLGWTEEIARMMLIILTYLGAVVCARKGTHIRVDFILEVFGRPFQRQFMLIVDLVSSIFFIFLGWTATQFAMKTSLEMSSIEIPKSSIFWVCSIALFLMALHYFIHFLSRLKPLSANKALGNDDENNKGYF